jgi:hypothetical protein
LHRFWLVDAIAAVIALFILLTPIREKDSGAEITEPKID